MSNNELYLILGCFGYRDDTFVSCPSIENKILNINEQLLYYNQIMDYLDNCHLFDKPSFDYNGIRHILFNLRDRFEQPTKRLWSEKKFNLIEKFTVDHKKCGLYIKLSLISSLEDNFENENSSLKKDEDILIPIEKTNKIHKLRLVRNR